MRKYYKSYETSWIARQLGRTVYSVRYKAVDLSLKKASPSVWKGNRGSNNAFRPTTRRASGMKTRRPSQRRRNQKAFKASSMMQTGRRPRRRMSRRISK